MRLGDVAAKQPGWFAVCAVVQWVTAVDWKWLLTGMAVWNQGGQLAKSVLPLIDVAGAGHDVQLWQRVWVAAAVLLQADQRSWRPPCSGVDCPG